MADPDLDVVALGSAIVDVLATATDEEIVAFGLVKGTMALVDAERSELLYKAMGPAVEASGGSAANTVAGVASFGGTAAFIGKVRDDQLGDVFRHDIGSVGVEFSTPPAVSGPPTGRCLIMVTPDAQRTMSTFLGAAVEIGPTDVTEDLLRRARITYLEGYLWDPPEAIGALRTAISLTHAAGGKVAFTLSDPFCVDRHRAEFLDVIALDVDVLFANEVEAMSLCRVPTLEEALDALAAMCEVAAVTIGAAGSIVVSGGERLRVPATPVAEVIDTTGAGDQYAAGFLFGLARGYSLDRCAELGAAAAAEVISHMGPRPLIPLRSLL